LVNNITRAKKVGCRLLTADCRLPTAD